MEKQRVKRATVSGSATLPLYGLILREMAEKVQFWMDAGQPSWIADELNAEFRAASQRAKEGKTDEKGIY